SRLNGVILPEKPRGGMYAFFAFDGEPDSAAVCRRVLENARVGLAPGHLFGEASRAFVRLCVFREENQLRTALDRMVEGLR
ncbi:MAG TPA: aspartate aminotransferase, partial [Methylomirabilota bacterium]|nr:aspartate aminotransferase [Methylomirabilota bacterium]